MAINGVLVCLPSAKSTVFLRCFWLCTSLADQSIRPTQLDSLESHEDELEPEPGHGQHEDHVREGETKPGGEIDDIAVLRKEPGGRWETGDGGAVKRRRRKTPHKLQGGVKTTCKYYNPGSTD